VEFPFSGFQINGKWKVENQLWKMKTFEIMREQIEKRLIDLALEINDLCKSLEKSYFTKHMSEQMIRSSTSAALNFSEAQGAESRNDYQHKTGVVLKELRETKTSLLLIRSSLPDDKIEKLKVCLDECDQLVAIFHKTVMTLKRGK
jgi:four helix bundle protein